MTSISSSSASSINRPASLAAGASSALETTASHVFSIRPALSCWPLALPYRTWRRHQHVVVGVDWLPARRIMFSENTFIATSNSGRSPESDVILCSDLPLVSFCSWCCSTCGPINPTTLVSARRLQADTRDCPDSQELVDKEVMAYRLAFRILKSYRISGFWCAESQIVGVERVGEGGLNHMWRVKGIGCDLTSPDLSRVYPNHRQACFARALPLLYLLAA